MVGSESEWAEKKRLYREKQKQLQLGQTEDNVREEIEYRDKSIENRNKEKEKKKEKEKDKKTYFENDNLNSIFIEFLEVRKKLKAVNSDRAIKTLINKLNKYDDDTKYQMIENSIVNSWKDVYELKQKKTTSYARQEIVPDWFDKNIEKEAGSKEEQDDLKNLIENFDNEPFEEQKEKLQERLKAKYGKRGTDD